MEPPTTTPNASVSARVDAFQRCMRGVSCDWGSKKGDLGRYSVPGVFLPPRRAVGTAAGTFPGPPQSWPWGRFSGPNALQPGRFGKVSRGGDGINARVCSVGQPPANVSVSLSHSADPVTKSGRLQSLVVGVLAFPWAVHALVVGASATGLRPLASAVAAAGILVVAGGVAATAGRLGRGTDAGKREETLSGPVRWLAEGVFAAGIAATAVAFVA